MVEKKRAVIGRRQEPLLYDCLCSVFDARDRFYFPAVACETLALPPVPPSPSPASCPLATVYMPRFILLLLLFFGMSSADGVDAPREEEGSRGSAGSAVSGYVDGGEFSQQFTGRGRRRRSAGDYNFFFFFFRMVRIKQQWSGVPNKYRLQGHDIYGDDRLRVSV